MKKVLFIIAFIPTLLLGQVELNFEGIQFSGEKPPDPVIAVGENHVVLAVNYRFEIYDKNGTFISGQTFSNFFNSVEPQPTGAIFDPKIAYDQYSNRYILLAIDGSHKTRYLLAVTASDDPTGDWYKYSIQGTLYDLDYPGLGYDENTIVLTSDSRVGSNSFSPDLTILNKQEIYSNNKSYQKDIRDISNGSKLKPVRVIGASPSKFYLVNTTSDGKVRIWSISNPLGGNPSWSLDKTITFDNYQQPQNAVQKGEAEKIEINTVGSSISDVVCKDGIIYGAYTVANTSGAGSSVKYFSADINNDFAILDHGLIESNDTYYYYPVIHPDGSGNMIMVFNKSSSNDYVGVAYTKHIKNNSSHEPISWLKQGAAGYKLLDNNNKNRWGDYSGIALDPENNYRIWIYGEWAKTSTTWSTWVGEINTAETLEFYFTNKYLETNLGGTLTVDNNSVNSGQPTPLEEGTNYNAKTNNERFPNWNSEGFTYKHNRWNDAVDEHYLEYSFEASNDELFYNARFDKMHYSKIAILLENTLQPDNGDINFQDPWYIKSDGSQPGNYWITSTNGYYEPNGKYGASEKGVFLDQGWPEWVEPFYKVNAPAQTININGSSRQIYFQNWEATDASLQFANQEETGIAFHSANAVVKANYKCSQLTNDNLALHSSSQRKLVRSNNGNLHLVYENLNRVWYEMSTDNGSIWTLMNNGKPLSNNNSKSPAITEVDGHVVLIAFQDEYYSGSSKINVVVFNDSQNLIKHTVSVGSGNYPSMYDAKPAIALDWKYHNVLVAYQDYDAFGGYYLDHATGYLTGGILANEQLELFETNGNIFQNLTDAHSPTIAVHFDPTIFHIAWVKQINGSSSKIYYTQINATYNHVFSPMTENDIDEPSSGCGYTKNYSPSIVAFEDCLPRLTWVGERVVVEDDDPRKINGIETPGIERRVLLRGRNYQGYWNSTFFKYGTDVNCVSMSYNETGSIGGYAFTWSQNDYELYDHKFIKNTAIYSTPSTLFHTQGKYLQLCNGDDLSEMYGMGLGTTIPYAFDLSENLLYYENDPRKTNSGNYLSIGREGIITNNHDEFYFTIKDVIVDGSEIQFTEVTENTKYADLAEFNTYLTTEAFDLNDNSAFLYTVQYGLINKDSVVTTFGDNKYLNFKVQMVDANSNEIIGEFDNVTYTDDNIFQYENIGYEVNTQGIGNRTVKLRLVVDYNIDPVYSLSTLFTEDNYLTKRNINKINFEGSLEVKEYQLAQNYPNPFNPATTINYQIPQDGAVKLVIYDALGREVRTLVNEFKTKGRYEAVFNANDLASGVYIYNLKVNDYVQTRKMMLLK